MIGSFRVSTGTSGARYDATYSYNANGGNVNLTGSPSYAARIQVVGDPGNGCSDNQYAFDTSAFAGPTYNSLGLSRARISSPDASRASWTCRSPATSG